MAKSPKKLNIRACHVGFGDCFLLSFEYGPGDEKQLLIDFGFDVFCGIAFLYGVQKRPSPGRTPTSVGVSFCLGRLS